LHCSAARLLLPQARGSGDAELMADHQPRSWVSCIGFYTSTTPPSSRESTSPSPLRGSLLPQPPPAARCRTGNQDLVLAGREFGGLQDGGRPSARAAGDLCGLRPCRQPPCVMRRHHHHHRLPPLCPAPALGTIPRMEEKKIEPLLQAWEGRR